ncbi:hypothetical protein AUJ78_01155 [Candidatus Peregrinibacteria bacterium CG1_02_41_10]|nr:MAG: hypothetical protein AUJ78_01155 [Candidatus Peregrinibacteria bacterium CG1_02_41_10]
MLPKVVIIGRVNVGKSSLFNRLSGVRYAITSPVPGTTRDYLEAEIVDGRTKYSLIDTGGLDLSKLKKGNIIEQETQKQARKILEDATLVVFLVDAKEGILNTDWEIVKVVRKLKKPTVLAANKCDGPKEEAELASIYGLGLGEPVRVSVAQGIGIDELKEKIKKGLKKAHLPLPLLGKEGKERSRSSLDKERKKCVQPLLNKEGRGEVIKLAIVGKQNVGKSSLLNAFLGEERAIVSDTPGTTLDTVDTFYTYADKRYLLIDTAGLKKRSQMGRGLLFLGGNRVEKAIERSDVCLLVLDGSAKVSRQDQHIAAFVLEAGKGVVIVVNKTDLLKAQTPLSPPLLRGEVSTSLNSPLLRGEVSTSLNPPLLRGEEIEGFKRRVGLEFPFLAWAPIVFVSAQTGVGIFEVFDLVDQVVVERKRRITTAELNRFLQNVTLYRQPPNGVRINYVTQVEISPPTFAFFCNLPDRVHFSYRRFLENRLRDKLGFWGTPVRLEFRRK